MSYTVYRAKDYEEKKEFCDIIQKFGLYKRIGGNISCYCDYTLFGNSSFTKEVLLAYDDRTGWPVGCAILTEPTSLFSDYGYEFNIYVKKNYRRKGIGTRLVKKMRALSKKEFEVFTFNRANEALFRKFKSFKENEHMAINPVKKRVK